MNINNFWCMSYIEKKIPELFEEQKASMAKGERPNPATKKLWQDCMKRKGEIERLKVVRLVVLFIQPLIFPRSLNRPHFSMALERDLIPV